MTGAMGKSVRQIRRIAPLASFVVCCLAGCAVPAASAPGDASAPAPVSAGSRSEELSPPRATPFLDARAREAEPGPQSELVGPGGAFRARVRGIVGPVTRSAAATLVEIDLGAGSPASCFFLGDGIDLASSLVNLSQTALETAAEGVTLTAKQLDRLDVTVRGGTPIFEATWVYRIETPERESLAGEIDVRVASHRGEGVACVHNEVGYRATLDRLIFDLVDSLSFAQAQSEPYFAEVAVLAVGAQPVGVTANRYVRDAEGATEITLVTSLALPLGPAELQAQDSYSFELSAPDGRLIRGRAGQVRSGTVVTDLELEPQASGGWTLAGRFEGKPIEAALAPRRVVSALGQTLQLRDALARRGAAASLAFPVWAPDVDPTAFVTTEIDVERRNEDGSFEATTAVGPLRGKATFLRDGTARRLELDVGDAALIVERVHVEGSIEAPAAADSPRNR